MQLLKEFEKPHEERTLYKFESGWSWYLPLYVLDKEELIEHGGNVGGGWLTEKGQSFLQRYGDLYGPGF